jgi:hypothetical protein
MKKVLIVAGLTVGCLILAAPGLFAQQQSATARQFMLIVRYPTDRPAPDAKTVETNGQHWGAYIGRLQSNGQLVSALRPEEGGRTLSGKEPTPREGAYSAGDKTVISSLFLIRAADLDAATAIAKECPIFELGGSVEIRAVR